MAKIGTYAVECPDFQKDGFKSREDAETWICRVEEFGQCRHEHEIKVVANV